MYSKTVLPPAIQDLGQVGQNSSEAFEQSRCLFGIMSLFLKRTILQEHEVHFFSENLKTK